MESNCAKASHKCNGVSRDTWPCEYPDYKYVYRVIPNMNYCDFQSDISFDSTFPQPIDRWNRCITTKVDLRPCAVNVMDEECAEFSFFYSSNRCTRKQPFPYGVYSSTDYPCDPFPMCCQCCHLYTLESCNDADKDLCSEDPYEFVQSDLSRLQLNNQSRKARLVGREPRRYKYSYLDRYYYYYPYSYRNQLPWEVK